MSFITYNQLELYIGISSSKRNINTEFYGIDYGLII